MVVVYENHTQRSPLISFWANIDYYQALSIMTITVFQFLGVIPGPDEPAQGSLNEIMEVMVSVFLVTVGYCTFSVVSTSSPYHFFCHQDSCI